MGALKRRNCVETWVETLVPFWVVGGAYGSRGSRMVVRSLLRWSSVGGAGGDPGGEGGAGGEGGKPGGKGGDDGEGEGG